MKIAVPTIGGVLDEYFESCEVFTIFTIDDSFNIIATELLYTPQGCDCKNNVPLLMQQKGVTFVLAFVMPAHADDTCAKYGIEIVTGYSGTVRQVAEDFLSKKK